MGNRDLPDTYTHTLWPAALGLGHIYQAPMAHVITYIIIIAVYYIYIYIYIYIYTYTYSVVAKYIAIYRQPTYMYRQHMYVYIAKSYMCYT